MLADQRLPHFGTYHNAITAENGFLFHSVLSFALNTKMLDPMAVIQDAIDRSQSTYGEASESAPTLFTVSISGHG
jgi:deoxyribodipyrimidine photolyase-related protein